MLLVKELNNHITVKKHTVVLDRYLEYAKQQMPDRKNDFLNKVPEIGKRYKLISKVYDENGLNLPYAYFILEDEERHLYIANELSLIDSYERPDDLPF